jgi:SPP1 family predicted phage head-tail adaptor
MDSGKLRHLITFNTYSTTTDAVSNESVEVYTTVSPPVWAEIRPMAGRELLNAQEIVGDSTHKIRVRYIAGVSRKDQITYNGDTYAIDSINNTDMRNVELVLTAHVID